MDADQGGSREPDEETVWAFHSLVMNGGVAHALEASDALGVARADVVNALDRLGLDDLAALVERVVADEDVDDECTEAWSDVVPKDAALEERIRRQSPGASSE